jgi:hypothetical protein
MNSVDNSRLVEVFGEQALFSFDKQALMIEMKDVKLNELFDLREMAAHIFNVNLSITDILVCTSAGVLTGCSNAMVKSIAIPHKELKKNPLTSNKFYQIKPHSTRTGIDYQTPKVGNFKNDLHRQLGPSHDIFRFKETIEIMKGEKTDFKLWDSTINHILGSGNPVASILRAKGMKVEDFIKLGGFQIPDNPKIDAIHHLLADFFTKTSLPIPGSTYIADHSIELAKIMYGMYDQGFNLKNLLGNSLGFIILQLIIYSYSFIFKVVISSDFDWNNVTIESIQNLLKRGLDYRRTNEFHSMMMISHGSSFLVDTLLTTCSQNYMGLFQLNYASLIWFSKHLLQYLIKCSNEYKQMMSHIGDITKEIELLENQLFNNFHNSIIEISYDERFINFVDPVSVRKSHIKTKNLMMKRKQLNLKLDSVIKETNNE